MERAAAVSWRMGAAMRQAIRPPSAEPTASTRAAIFHYLPRGEVDDSLRVLLELRE